MDDINTHFLYPASLFACIEPYKVSTILGSCVAVCLYDSVLKIGGINHYMLPFWNGQGLASPKYGNIAIERLLEKMLFFGCNKINIKAKIFGGGEVIETNITQFHIGQRNIKLALEMLDELKIPIIAKSVGGNLGRKIEYNTATGEVKQKYIEKTNVNLNK
jgi:chemotaxis protein CheD